MKVYKIRSIVTRLIFLHLISINAFEVHAQTNGNNLANATFFKSDIDNFWKAFDKVEAKKNPFIKYLEEGSIGLKDFVPYRIGSAKNLLKTVKAKKQDYMNLRTKTNNLNVIEDAIKSHYQEFKKLHPEAIFPPVYFVIGAFTSGGGVSPNGIIIGTEVAKNDLKNIEYFVMHELMHFNQQYPQKPIGKATLLEKAIVEGSADFLASLIIKKDYVNEYAEAHLEELCAEFVEIMNGTKYQSWLYGSKGKKEGRPNDLGYWMGYKITEAYYENATDKNQAIYDILHIGNFDTFLKKSGYLYKWLKW